MQRRQSVQLRSYVKERRSFAELCILFNLIHLFTSFIGALTAFNNHLSTSCLLKNSIIEAYSLYHKHSLNRQYTTNFISFKISQWPLEEQQSYLHTSHLAWNCTTLSKICSATFLSRYHRKKWGVTLKHCCSIHILHLYSSISHVKHVVPSSS